VHVYQKELDAALTRPSLQEKGRYIPAQWAHGPNWAPRDVTGETWLGFDAIRALPHTDDEVLLVPLTGHTQGQCGVAVRTDQAWLLLTEGGLKEQVRQDGNRYNLHSKVFIIDHQVVVMGSYNFSNNAENSNDENILIIRNAEIAAAYFAEWERVWAEAQR